MGDPPRQHGRCEALYGSHPLRRSLVFGGLHRSRRRSKPVLPYDHARCLCRLRRLPPRARRSVPRGRGAYAARGERVEAEGLAWKPGGPIRFAQGKLPFHPLCTPPLAFGVSVGGREKVVLTRYERWTSRGEHGQETRSCPTKSGRRPRPAGIGVPALQGRRGGSGIDGV